MNQDEIIEMARQAGGSTMRAYDYGAKPSSMIMSYEELEAFAKLVDAKATAREREACAQTCENIPIPDQYSDSEGSMFDVAAIECAEAIRARGEA